MTTVRKKLWIARFSCYNHDSKISGCSAVGSARDLGHCCMMFERFFSNPGNPCSTMFSCPSYWIKVMKCLVFTTILTTMKWFFLFFLIYYFLISGCSSVDRTRGLGPRGSWVWAPPLGPKTLWDLLISEGFYFPSILLHLVVSCSRMNSL